MEHTVFSPAKINLKLNITGRRDDGYHDIDSIFAKLNFGDELIFEDKKEGIEIRSTGDYKVPTNADNLVFQAADLMRRRAKGKRGVRITIHKNIPVGAGLGGGSSNAATTLKFLNEHWNIHLGEDELMNLGLQLGSDVPFFVQSSPVARVTGIGNIISDYSENMEGKLLLFIPKYISINTAWAYKELVNWYKGDYNQEQGMNAFEAPIFNKYPDLLGVKQVFTQMGATTGMTGSGSVIFGIFKNDLPEEEIKSALKGKGDLIFTEFFAIMS